MSETKLPPCNHCGATPAVEAVGPESDRQHFVICRGRGGDEGKGCAGPDTKGFRPLTNGWPAPKKAEDAWIEEVKRMVANNIPGYRMAS